MDRREFLGVAGAGTTTIIAGCADLAPGGDGTDADSADGSDRESTTQYRQTAVARGPFEISVNTPAVAFGAEEESAPETVALVEAQLREDYDGTLRNPTYSFRVDDARIRRLVPGDFVIDSTATDTAAAGFDLEWEPGTSKSVAVTFVPTTTGPCTFEVEFSGDAGEVESGAIAREVPVREPGAPVTRGQLAGLARYRAAAATQYAETIDDTANVGYDDQLRQALRGVTLSGGVMVGDALVGTAVGVGGTAVDAVWQGLSQHVSPFQALVDFEPVGPGDSVDRKRVESEAYAPPFFSALLDQGQGILQRFERQLKTGGDIEYAAQRATVLLATVADRATAEAQAWENEADDRAQALLMTQQSLLDGTGIGDIENENELFPPHADRVDASLGTLGLDQVGDDSTDQLRQTLGLLTANSTARRNFPQTVQAAYSLRGFVTGEGRQIGHLRSALRNGLLTGGTTRTTGQTTTASGSGTLVDGFEDGSHEDRWEITKNQSDASASVVSDRAYRGDRSLRIHIGETYSGDYALRHEFDDPVPPEAVFQCWCYPMDRDPKLVYDLRSGDERVMIQLSPFGDVRYKSPGTESANVLADSYSAEEWQRLAVVARPDAAEATVRYEGPDGSVRGKTTVQAPSSYDFVRVFGGDYYGNVDVYLDDVSYAPAPS